MDYINLLHQVPNQVKNLYRKLENHHQKCIKNKWSWTFNTVCLKENLMPTFTNFNLHDPALYNTRETLQYKRQLILREINVKEKK